MVSDEKEFKVVDRRAASGNVEEKPSKDAKGEGFTMKENDSEQSGDPRQLDFPTLILSFATSAMINLGIAPDPVTGKRTKNLELAKQNIEILTILQQKTKGNLTPDENQLMENVLAEVRLRFVEASKQK